MTTSDLNQLIEFGFPKQRAEIALKKSGNLQGALDWLSSNENTTDEEIQAETSSKSADNYDDDATAEPPALKDGEVANSLVCDDCSKRFRSNAQAEFHAVKSGHQEFSQSTEEIAPLTEEEKKAKLVELRTKAAERKVLKAKQDKEEEKKNAKIAAKSTREIQDAKEELAKKEQINEAKKKRAEKLADIEAKKRIKEKIEADKEERRLKAEKLKAEREGRAMPMGDPTAKAAQEAQAAAPQKREAKDFVDARLRLQTPQGPVTKTFLAETTLFEVAAALNKDAQDGFQVDSFTQTFPKKTYNREDFEMTLKEAGQVPSGVLVVKFA